MKRQIRLAITALAAATTIGIAGLGSPALANTPEESHFSFLKPMEVPESLDAENFVADKYSAEYGIPADASHRLIQATLDHPELRVASTAWNEDTQKLTLYSAADAATATAVLKGNDLDAWVDYAPAARSADEVNALISEIIGTTGELPSGDQVAMVLPSADAASVDIVLDEERATAKRSDSPPPELSAPGLEVNVTYGSMPKPTFRNINGATYKFSGAIMTNTNAACSTGYRLIQNGTNAAAMGSAHHCGAGEVDGVSSALYPAWWYSNNPANGWSLGNFQGGIYPGGAAYGDSAVWTGGGVGGLYPAVLIGDNTGAGSAATLIRGVVSSAVGNRMCYSGSFSGTVCNNYVDNTNSTACYGAPLPCYNGLVRTHQTTGVAAIGQGDSGGPVYGTINGQPYAAGIVSGISSPLSTCTGDQFRDCSIYGIYSPITEYFGAGYGVAVVPNP